MLFKRMYDLYTACVSFVNMMAYYINSSQISEELHDQWRKYMTLAYRKLLSTPMAIQEYQYLDQEKNINVFTVLRP